jgi:hypothetical protein
MATPGPLGQVMATTPAPKCSRGANPSPTRDGTDQDPVTLRMATQLFRPTVLQVAIDSPSAVVARAG